MRKINLGALMWSLTLLLAILCLAGLLITGELAHYLDVGIWGPFGLAILALFLLFIVSLRQWRSRSPLSSFGLGHLLFLLPLLLGLTFRPGPLSLSAFEGSGILGVTLMGEPSPAAPAHLPEGPLVITESNFSKMMELLWWSGDDVQGREVEMVGFVYRDPSLGPEDFVLARLMITCCADDADVAGLLCRWPDRQTLGDGQWVRVSGKLGRLPFYNMQTHQVDNMPFITVQQLDKVEKPAQEYVYP